MHTIKLLILSVSCLVIGIPLSAHAETYTVTTTTDFVDSDNGCVITPSNCSLREAFIIANDNAGSDTIVIPAGTYALNGATTSGEDLSRSGDLDIYDTSGTLTVTGAGSGVTIIDGNDTDRVIDTISGTTSIIQDLTLTNGTTTGSGGGIRTSGTTTLDSVVVSNSVMSGMSFGGGIRCDGNTLNIIDSTISGNSVSGSNGGGGINGNLCNLSISGSTFSSNTAGASGGAMLLTMESNTITIDETTFVDNASNSGGAIVLIDAGTPTTVASITNTVFSGNTAIENGGAMYIAQPIRLTNVTMTENAAGAHGGAIYVDGSSTDAEPTISFSTFTKNIADSDNNSSGTGGAFYINGTSSDVVIRNSLFAANYLVSTSGTANDCTASTDLVSLNYNYIGTATGCTFSAQANDSVGSGARSYMFTAELADNGGVVESMRMWGDETLNLVPGGSCLDAAGAALTRDARGVTRAQGSGCEIGAYERDQTNPTVTITSGDDTIECNVESFTDAGATATDNFSTGLTASLTSGTVNAAVLGQYTLTYESSLDSDFNGGTNSRLVTVNDTRGPVITVTGNTTEALTVGDAYTDSGATVIDACDATITLQTNGTVDTNTPGTYTITYSASDDTGNAATQKTRTVTVSAVAIAEPELELESPVAPNRIQRASIRINKRSHGRVINWPDVGDAIFYKLKLTTKQGAVVLLIDDLAGSKKILTARWLANHLIFDQLYHIKLKACNDTGCSKWSNPKRWRY